MTASSGQCVADDGMATGHLHFGSSRRVANYHVLIDFNAHLYVLMSNKVITKKVSDLPL